MKHCFEWWPTPKRGSSQSALFANYCRRLNAELPLLGMVIAFAIGARVSHAAPVGTFQYQNPGTTVEMMAKYVYQQNDLFDRLGNFVGTVDARHCLYDMTDYVVLIMLYDADGIAQDVTSSYHYQEHHVFDLAGNLVGDVDALGNITNMQNQNIGYMMFVPAS